MAYYYRERLSAERLERAYEVAPPRVKQYLNAEIDHVLGRLEPGAAVLELGCGYGSVLDPLARAAGFVCGVDTSVESLAYGRRALERFPRCHLVAMDAARLAFRSGAFDCTVCIQNGISAFHVDPRELMRESIRVTRQGGLVLFSSYADAFWDHRLEWFELQAREGLVGPIDREKTRDGRIVCTDGFTATTVNGPRFAGLARGIGASARFVEVDSSSIFCEIVPGDSARREKGLI